MDVIHILEEQEEQKEGENDAIGPEKRKFVQLKGTKDITKHRNSILEEQGGVCAICKLTCKKYVLDHQHKRKRSDENGVNGNGCIRGVLCDGCNRIEGKVWNNAIRFGKHEMLPQLLRNMADYLERETYPLIHPSEKPVPRRVSKKKYKQLVKLMKEHEGIEPPKIPLTKKGKPRELSITLKSCFIRYGIDPYL